MDIIETVEKKEYENVLPLVNIVFLLLIFFMIAGTFSKPEALSVDIPTAKLLNPAAPEEVTIIMNHEQFAIDDKIYTKDELLNFITTKQQEKNTLAIQLKIDSQAPSKKLLTLMQDLAAIDVSSIHLLTVNN